MNLRKYTRIARYALYDGGNSNYDTLVVALAFPLFLKGKDLEWGAMFAVATLCAAILGPKVGALTDRWGAKFCVLRWMSIAAIAGTLLMAFLPAGRVFVAGALFVATQCAFLLAALLYNSALADVSTRKNAAMISSVAWGVGYIGGLLGLLIALRTSVIYPEETRLRFLFVIAAVMFFVFSLPLLLMRRREERPPPAEPRSLWLIPLLRSFMGDAKRSRLFIAFFLYTNGVNTVIIFTSRYAQQTLGFDIDELIHLFIVMNIVAAPAAIIFGKVAETLGQLATLKFVVAAWAVVVLFVCYAGFKQDKTLFFIVACCAASLIGPVQALSRSLFRIIFPENSMSAYFGVQSLANRSAALVGPLLFGLVSWATGNQILGALSSGILFAGGLAVLYLVPRDIEAPAAEATLEKIA